MTHFESFTNLEDMLNTIHERAAQAMERLHPVQRTITAGMYVMCPVQELGVLVFGKTSSDLEILDGEVRSGASHDEAIYTLRNLTEARERGYYFGRWYSTLCPEGEFGDQHVSRCWPITTQEFEEARDNQWTLSTETYVAILERYFPEREEVMDE